MCTRNGSNGWNGSSKDEPNQGSETTRVGQGGSEAALCVPVRPADVVRNVPRVQVFGCKSQP